ncbi:MAG: PASTA domain-containing protein, partial [Candidatus Delongbacteria bacterium]
NRGLVYYFMDDFANAESNFDKALELDPGLAMAYNNKAVLSYERRDFTGAIAHFNKVLFLDPELEQTYFNRAFAYHKIGSSELCIKDLEQYLRLAGNKNGDENRIKNFIKDLKEPKPVEVEPVYCKVPDLYYSTPGAAEKKLKEAGLVLGVTHRITDIDKGFDRVIGQSVSAGNELETGSAVDITVNVEAEDEGW